MPRRSLDSSTAARQPGLKLSHRRPSGPSSASSSVARQSRRPPVASRIVIIIKYRRPDRGPGRPEAATVTSISHVAQKRRHEPPTPTLTRPHAAARHTSRATVRYTLTTLHGPHTSIRPTRSKYKDALTGDAYCTGRYLYSSSSGGTGLARQALPPAGMRLHGGSESMGGTGFSSFVLYILARCSRYTSAYSFSTLACRRSK